MQDDREKIEMFLSCRSLKNFDTFSKSDPQVILKVKHENGQFFEQERTEVIQNNLNPNFMKTFTFDYIFEIQQHIRFEVIDVDGKNSYDFIGQCDTTISKLMGAKNQTSILELKGKGNAMNGKLIIRCEKVGSCREILQARIAGEKIADIHTFSKTSPFLKFFRTREDGQLLLIYKTEQVNSNLNPIFKPFDIKLSKLCNGDHHLPIKVECWDYQSNGSHNYVGETTFTISELEQSKKRFELKNPKKNNKSAGFLNFQSYALLDKPEFIDFIRGGTQLSLITAIDFTGSNGSPKHPNSLHAIYPNQQLNQYQQAIVAVGDILINYDYNKMVPTFGFGGKPKLPYFSSNVALHCFPVNGHPENAQCNGIRGVLDAYSYLLQNVELAGPTLFNPIIQETMKISQIHKDQNSPVYNILLILTDGVIHDMDATITSIVNSAYLPMSIIIIGIGNEDFTNMEILDGDNGLYDSRGNKAQRDLVQFVPFNQFKGNPTELAKNVLYELPDQVVQYYGMIGQKPRQAEVVDITAMTGLYEPTEQLGKGLAQAGFMQNLIKGMGVGMEQQQQQQPQQQPLYGQPQFGQEPQQLQQQGSGGFMANLLQEPQQSPPQPKGSGGFMANLMQGVQQEQPQPSSCGMFGQNEPQQQQQYPPGGGMQQYPPMGAMGGFMSNSQRQPTMPPQHQQGPYYPQQPASAGTGIGGQNMFGQNLMKQANQPPMGMGMTVQPQNQGMYGMQGQQPQPVGLNMSQQQPYNQQMGGGYPQYPQYPQYPGQ